MDKKTDTQERFEEELQELNNKISQSKMTFNDATKIHNLASNLLLRYEQIIKSRDKWKTKFYKLKEDGNN